MTSPRFLFDEHVSHALGRAMVQQEPAIDIVYVGHPGAPPRGTQDPDLLLAAEALGRLLVTKDKRTMPQHLAAHFAAGHHTCGVVLMRDGFPLSRYLQDLLLIWYATTADEWVDRTDVIPY